jgi:hypothetical protein
MECGDSYESVAAVVAAVVVVYSVCNDKSKF